MKRNLLYLAGFLLAAATIFSGCNDDDPSYHNLVPDTQELIINFDKTPQGTIQMLQGNGNYKIASSDEEVATAVAEGNMIKVTALKAGSTNLTITDWAQMSTSVKVIVDQLSELVLAVSSTKMYPGENKTINIHTGNRGYKVTVDKESIAKATVDEEGHIQVESLAPGIATVTVTDRLNKTAELSVKVAFSLIGIMAFWLGMMKIAEKCGLISIIAKIIKPITKRLFNEIPENSPAIGDIAMSFSANAFGLTNAATPIGIKAMEELQKQNKDKSSASNAMCMFLAMNTAGFQLIPATVIAILIGIGYKNPTEIIAPTLLVTSIAFISAILLAKIFQRFWAEQLATNADDTLQKEEGTQCSNQ